MECKNNKVIDNSNVPEMTETEAWHALKTASDDYDIDDFKEGLKALSKANPKITYLEIEQELRKRHFNVYLIGMKKEIAAAYTNVNLQGETGKTFTLGVFLRSEKCPRPILMVAWPKTPEDNLARLSDTGVTMESGIQVSLTTIDYSSTDHPRSVAIAASQAIHERLVTKRESLSTLSRSPACFATKKVIVLATVRTNDHKERSEPR